ncbi:DUF3748 domain-containing protein [Thorsellia anophelis]|uniref:WD40-like Beta Propeller Repeat n=1 Tax=Thorsellia anophelis DSM 18579 TaxID=1123402 RepID=A0A1H9YA60_9GAMM|nr:DUF3748 domain-containing protein [Thorsellia anophelis]SES65826.1 WD40-like Beta Propeller Repeat [Thorsellia anophelis DSM 18579]
MLKQITSQPEFHQLTNAQVWSSDSNWLVYDCRKSQSKFDNTVIERINIHTGEIECIYRSSHQACVGVVTANPAIDNQYIFIHGPENPYDAWQYNFHYRRGVIATCDQYGHWQVSNLDSFNESIPRIPGVLSGGSHVHMFSHDGTKVSFTYDDFLLSITKSPFAKRNVAIGYKGPPVSFIPAHDKQYVGEYYCALITQTTDLATFGSDEIEKAYEECWIGNTGYLLSDGTRQRWSIAYMGDVRTEEGNLITEIFIADLPNDESKWHTPHHQHMTEDKLLLPPTISGIRHRRLTHTQDRLFPGICHSIRHWLRSSPCGQYIACLMKDSHGVTQLCIVETKNGLITQLTHSISSMQSAFTWHPSGSCIAIACNNAIYLSFIKTKVFIPITQSLSPPINPEAVVCSPDGRYIAFTRDIPIKNNNFRQIFTQRIADVYLALM